MMNKLFLDLSRGMFAAGQLYVALSRVRSLGGLFLSHPIIPQYAHTSREVLQYASGYNDELVISNEIESGKAVYVALSHHDYDHAAQQYLLLVQKKALEGDVKEAMQQTKRFLDTMIDDEELYGSISEIPVQLMESNHWAPRFLVALLSLYTGNYEQALTYVDSVLAQHQCQEALFVKSRCLAKLGRYAEADAVNVLLSESLDMASLDAKVVYMIAMLNELHIGDPGLDLMQLLIAARPKYQKAILSLRMLMKRKGLSLVKTSNEPRELVDEFNSDMAGETFAERLSVAYEKAPKAVEYLRKLIKQQKFGELNDSAGS